MAKNLFASPLILYQLCNAYIGLVWGMWLLETHRAGVPLVATLVRRVILCNVVHYSPMQSHYFARLGEPVQEFVREVEERARVDIEVIPSSELDDCGPLGQGHLEIIITARRIQLFVPTNGYFPDGAVRHEVLHMHRFHIEGVPQLRLADEQDWDQGFADALGAIDNAIEHVIIVPVELQLHPERREHWEAVMRNVWSELPYAPEGERYLAASLHWTFLRHVLPDSPQIQVARNFMIEHSFLDNADDFANQFISATANKEEMVRILFQTFPEIPRDRAALEYLNSVTGTRQTPIA